MDKFVLELDRRHQQDWRVVEHEPSPVVRALQYAFLLGPAVLLMGGALALIAF